MRITKLYDGKEEYSLASFDTREQALLWIQKGDRLAKCALFPSLSADIGMISFSPLWDSRVTPEAFRAVSYYLGVLCGWPMEEVTVETENKNAIPLPLYSAQSAENSQKIKICKQLFEKTTIFTSSVSHEAIRVRAELDFFMIVSDCVSAVDFSAAEGFRMTDALRVDFPICFASLSDGAMQLRAYKRGVGALSADDFMHMHALAYFVFDGRAAPDRFYEAAGGSYRMHGAFAAESLRAVMRSDPSVS